MLASKMKPITNTKIYVGVDNQSNPFQTAMVEMKNHKLIKPQTEKTENCKKNEILDWISFRFPHMESIQSKLMMCFWLCILKIL